MSDEYYLNQYYLPPEPSVQLVSSTSYAVTESTQLAPVAVQYFIFHLSDHDITHVGSANIEAYLKEQVGPGYEIIDVRYERTHLDVTGYSISVQAVPATRAIPWYLPGD